MDRRRVALSANYFAAAVLWCAASASGAAVPDPEPAVKRDIYMQDVSWFPDGQHFTFSRYDAIGPYDHRHWSIWVADRDGGNPRVVLREAVYASVSPDGKRLATALKFDGDYELVTVNVDGSDLRRLTTRPGEDELPDWSPDGKFLVYCSKRDGRMDLFQIAADGGDPKQLTSTTADEYNPVYSPAADAIVFYREVGDRHDQVWTMDLDSGREVRISDPTLHNFFPSYLPDGRIAYSSGLDGGKRRLVVATAGKQESEPLGPDGVFFARWSPDGKEVLFLVNNDNGKIRRMAADGTTQAVVLDTSLFARPAATAPPAEPGKPD